jgi:hypothetical protein
MKKILYILTSLILLLPNLSFGQGPTQYICKKPANINLGLSDTAYSIGDSLLLGFAVFENDGYSTETLPNLTYNIIGPNGFSTSPVSLAPNVAGLDNILVKNNLKFNDSGKYYVRFVQTGCPTTLDSINISISYGNYTPLPSYENFDSFDQNWNYPNWTFKGQTNETNNKGYWFGTKSKHNTLYNCLVHYSGLHSSYKNDTILSPIYANNITNDTTHLGLNFSVNYSLRDLKASSYDTLIVNAYFSSNETPVNIYKKGGYSLNTVGPTPIWYNPNSSSKPKIFYVPKSQITNFKTEFIRLYDYDTCSTVQFEFIHKPSSLNSTNTILLDDINVKAIPIDTFYKSPTITVDSVYNSDNSFSLTINVPQNHNYGQLMLFRRFANLQNNAKIQTIDYIDEKETPKQNNLFRNYYENGLLKQIGIFYPPYYNDTTFTVNFSNEDNNISYFFTGNMDTTSAIFCGKSDEVLVSVIYKEPPLAIGSISVDSLYNKDKNFTVTMSIPQNHYAKSYILLENNIPIQSGSISDNNSKVITYNKANSKNGDFKYKLILLNPNKIKNEPFVEPIKKTESNKIFVSVNYGVNLLQSQLTIDSIINKDKNFNLTISLPSNHNVIEYGLVENNTIIESFKLTNSTSSVNKIIPIVGKANGKYTYYTYVKNSLGTINSQPTEVTVNYTVPPALACTTDVIAASNKTKTNFTYSFKLNINCSNTGYKALFYAGNNANGFLASNTSLTEAQVNLLSWTPTNGTPRNGVGIAGNIQLTQNEIKTGFFNRKVDKPLSFGNKWYRVDIVCTSCNQLNKTRTAYFYVTN